MSIKLTMERKLAEHRNEIDGCLNMLDQIEIEMKQAISKKRADAPVYAQKLMILKDKMTFHNACASTLADLLKELEGES